MFCRIVNLSYSAEDMMRAYYKNNTKNIKNRIFLQTLHGKPFPNRLTRNAGYSPD